MGEWGSDVYRENKDRQALADEVNPVNPSMFDPMNQEIDDWYYSKGDYSQPLGSTGQPEFSAVPQAAPVTNDWKTTSGNLGETVTPTKYDKPTGAVVGNMGLAPKTYSTQNQFSGEQQAAAYLQAQDERQRAKRAAAQPNAVGESWQSALGLTPTSPESALAQQSTEAPSGGGKGGGGGATQAQNKQMQQKIFGGDVGLKKEEWYQKRGSDEGMPLPGAKKIGARRSLMPTGQNDKLSVMEYLKQAGLV